MVDKVMTSVKGGTLASAVTMRAKLNKDGLMDIDTYQTWARSIADAPALLYSEVGSKSKDFFRGFFCRPEEPELSCALGVQLSYGTFDEPLRPISSATSRGPSIRSFPCTRPTPT